MFVVITKFSHTFTSFIAYMTFSFVGILFISVNRHCVHFYFITYSVFFIYFMFHYVCCSIFWILPHLLHQDIFSLSPIRAVFLVLYILLFLWWKVECMQASNLCDHFFSFVIICTLLWYIFHMLATYLVTCTIK